MTQPLVPAALPAPVFLDAGYPPVKTKSDRPLDEVAVRDLMWRSVGVFRDRERLQQAAAWLDWTDRERQRGRSAGSIRTPADWRTANLTTVAHLIAKAALRREESRGGHFRSDFPVRDDEKWKVHVSEIKTREVDSRQ
jgi:L-aspartate oxidase